MLKKLYEKLNIEILGIFYAVYLPASLLLMFEGMTLFYITTSLLVVVSLVFSVLILFKQFYDPA